MHGKFVTLCQIYGIASQVKASLQAWASQLQAENQNLKSTVTQLEAEINRLRADNDRLQAESMRLREIIRRSVQINAVLMSHTHKHNHVHDSHPFHMHCAYRKRRLRRKST